MSFSEILCIVLVGIVALAFGGCVYVANSAIDAFNARADRDSVRLDTLLNQTMAISEQNLEWMKIDKAGPAPSKAREFVPTPEPMQRFDMTVPGGPDGGIGGP